MIYCDCSCGQKKEIAPSAVLGIWVEERWNVAFDMHTSPCKRRIKEGVISAPKRKDREENRQHTLKREYLERTKESKKQKDSSTTKDQPSSAKMDQ